MTAAPPHRAHATATCTSTRTAARWRHARPSSRRTRRCRPTGRSSARSACNVPCWSSRPATASTTAAPLDALAQLGDSAPAWWSCRPTSATPSCSACMIGGVRGVRFMMLPGAGPLLPWDGAADDRRAHRAARLAHRPAARRPRDAAARGGAARAARAGSWSTTSAASTAPPRPTARPSPRSAACSTPAAAGSRSRRRSGASRLGPPDYADIAPLARALAERYPERCLWASNWPHPNVVPRPADTAMVDWALRLHRRRAGAAPHPGRQPGRGLRLLSAGDGGSRATAAAAAPAPPREQRQQLLEHLRRGVAADSGSCPSRPGIRPCGPSARPTCRRSPRSSCCSVTQ